MQLQNIIFLIQLKIK